MADIYAFNPFTTNLDKTFSGTAVAIWGTMIGTLSNQTDLQNSIGSLQLSMSAVAPLQFNATGRTMSIVNVGNAADGYLTSTQFIALGGGQSHNALAGLDYATAGHTGFQASISAVAPITLTGNTVSSVSVTAAADGHLTSSQYLLISMNAIGSLTANTPITFTGGSSGVFNMSVATVAINGYLQSSNFILWSSNVVSGVTATAPINFTGSGGAISMSAATNAIDGYLTSSNWITFNTKQDSIGALAPITLTGTSVGITNVTAAVDGYLTSNQYLLISMNAIGNLTANLPMTFTGGSSGVFNMSNCSAAIDGYLTSTQYIALSSGSGLTGVAPIIVGGGSAGITNVGSTAAGYLTSSQYIDITEGMTTDRDYYVLPTGSDLGTGASGSPLATIKHALDLLPKNLGGHAANIHLYDGTYTEDGIEISSFRNGGLNIYGENSDETKVLIRGVSASGVNMFSLTASSDIDPYFGYFSGEMRSDYYSVIYGGNGRTYVASHIAVGTDGVATDTRGITAAGGNVDASYITDINASKVAIGLSSLGDSIVFDSGGNTAGSVNYQYGGMVFDGVNGFLLTPEIAPTTNYQVANRKFVLDNIGASAGFARLEMSSANIIAGIFTITHTKGLSLPCSVMASVFSNLGEQVIPDRVVGSTNAAYLDMTSYGAISGTYGILYLA